MLKSMLEIKRALNLAAQNGSMKVLRYMMEEKKCYDPSEYNGLDTPLHYAASSGKEEVVYTVSDCTTI